MAAGGDVKRVIEVVPHDPEWARQFAQEAEEWREVMGGEIIDVHHVGSTAIQGVSAKPIIDLVIVVQDIERVDAYDAEMTRRGYLPRGEYGIPGRRYFIKGTEIHRTHHIHVYGDGSPEIARHIAFRDYMNAHPDEAAAYGRLKEELAAAHPHDIDAYVDGKDGFIKAAQARALTWARAQADERLETEGRGG